MKKRNIIKIFSIIILILLVIYNFYHYLDIKYNKILIEHYISDKDNNIDKTSSIINLPNYSGILEIPKINLIKGFYDVDDKNNNVNKNIQVLKNSIMPDKDLSLLAIASHSGNGTNAYFKNLHKLKLNDIAYVYYQDLIYEYEIQDIYEVNKNGKISVNQLYNKMLLLTTCSKHKDKQLVIIAKLIKQKASDSEAFNMVLDTLDNNNYNYNYHKVNKDYNYLDFDLEQHYKLVLGELNLLLPHQLALPLKMVIKSNVHYLNYLMDNY